MDIFSFSRRFIKRTSSPPLPVDFYATNKQTHKQTEPQSAFSGHTSVRTREGGAREGGARQEEDLLVHDVAEEQHGLDDHEDDEVERGQAGRDRGEVRTLEHLLHLLRRVLGEGG